MYHNLGVDQQWASLKKIAESGPINWQEGVMCQFIGWKRFSNSTWEKPYQGYRQQGLRVSLDLPSIINKFLTHMLATLLLSVVLFIAAIFMPDDWEVVKMIGFWQLVLWSLVYCGWGIILLKNMRSHIRRGFREIEASIPGLKLQFSMFCDCICGCINQNYITIFLKE